MLVSFIKMCEEFKLAKDECEDETNEYFPL